MEFSCRFSRLEEYDIEKKVSNLYIKAKPLSKQILVTEGKRGIKLSSQLLSTDGLIIFDTRMIFAMDAEARVEIKGNCRCMLFIFELNGKESPYLKNYTHNIIHFTNGFKHRFKLVSETSTSVFIVLLSNDFYYNLLQQSSLEMEFSDFILHKNFGLLYDDNLPIDAAAYSMVYQIRNCKRKGLYKRLYIENKVQELLLQQFEMRKLHQQWKELSWLREEDLLKLQNAKRIIETDFNEALNLTGLSKEINLNEFKLKKGFKACFGITIKKYMISLRMEYALKLLRSNQYNISEIAYLTGYKGLPQFSTAFKSFYGFPPKTIHNGISSKLNEGSSK